MAKDIDVQKESGTGHLNAGYIMQDSEELSTPSNGEWHYYPRGSKGVSIVLIATGSGRIETTNADYDSIKNNTVDPSEVVPWPKGNLSAVTEADFLLGANAFRQVNISGITKMQVMATQ